MKFLSIHSSASEQMDAAVIIWFHFFVHHLHASDRNYLISFLIYRELRVEPIPGALGFFNLDKWATAVLSSTVWMSLPPLYSPV